MLTVRIVNHSPYSLPEYATSGAAGMDLKAHLPEGPITLQSLERKLIPTGLFIELPQGYEAQIRPRSGMAFKRGLSVPNSPGTIDSDYRGEILVAIVNLDAAPQIIEPGERIAQMVIAKHETITWIPAESLESSHRGTGGFGSTGS